MTHWSDETIQNTINHFRDHYGAELSTDDAIESLDNLVAYFQTLIRWSQEKDPEQEERPTSAGENQDNGPDSARNRLDSDL